LNNAVYICQPFSILRNNLSFKTKKESANMGKRTNYPAGTTFPSKMLYLPGNFKLNIFISFIFQ